MNNSFDARVSVAASCSDTSAIPKVPNAGSVVLESDGRRVQLMHNGIKVSADGYYGAFTTEIVRRLRGHHEPQEEKVFHEALQHIRSGGVMIELGSYWSYYSLWFHAAVPGAITYMVEPCAANLECGRCNFALNHRSGTFVHALIGHDEVAGADPPVHTVDYLADAWRLEGIDILHADIQGHEFDMLRGAQGILRDGKVQWLFISTHSLTLHFKCLAELKRHGFFIVAMYTPQESYSVDGLLVGTIDRSCFRTVPVSRRPLDAYQRVRTCTARLYAPFH